MSYANSENLEINHSVDGNQICTLSSEGLKDFTLIIDRSLIEIKGMQLYIQRKKLAVKLDSYSN